MPKKYTSRNLKSSPIDFLKLIFSIGLCLGTGLLGSIFTGPSITTWYATLNKPAFSPPNWVFAPVWTTLFILMGISLYLIWITKDRLKQKAFNLFFVQLALNVLWSILFFGMHNPILAFVDILILWWTIFLTIKAFSKINKLAGQLLWLYLAWVSFATLLNLSIIILN